MIQNFESENISVRIKYIILHRTPDIMSQLTRKQKLTPVVGISAAVLLIVFAVLHTILQMQSIAVGLIMGPGPDNGTILVYALSCILSAIIAFICGKRNDKRFQIAANILWIILWALLMIGLIVAEINLYMRLCA